MTRVAVVWWGGISSASCLSNEGASTVKPLVNRAILAVTTVSALSVAVLVSATPATAMARSYYVIKNNSTGFCLSSDWAGNVKTVSCESEPGTSQPRYEQQWYPAQGTGNDPDQTYLLKNRRTSLCLSMDYTPRPPDTGAVTAVPCNSSYGSQWLTPHTVNGRLEAFYGGRLFDESGSARVRLYNGTVNPVAASLWKASCLTSGGCAADLWGPPA